jgi:Glycosyltransferase family 92
VPKHMFFLQHIYRAANFSKPGIGAKAFQSTNLVIAMHNHFPIICFGEYCDYVYIPQEDAQLNHYRRDCENYPKDECEGFKKNTVKDVTLWKYKDELIEKMNKNLKSLKVDF